MILVSQGNQYNLLVIETADLHPHQISYIAVDQKLGNKSESLR